MPKVSEAYKEERIRTILDCAMDCFAQKGFSQTTMDDIVAASGMSKGAIYNYFKSKEDMYLMLLDHALERTLERFNTLFQTKEMCAEEKIRHLFQVYQSIDLNDKEGMNRRSVQLEFWVNAFRNTELSDKLLYHKEKAIKFIAQILEEGINTGEFNQGIDSMLIAESFWAFTDGLFLHVLVDRVNYPFKNMYQQFERMFINSIVRKDKGDK